MTSDNHATHAPDDKWRLWIRTRIEAEVQQFTTDTHPTTTWKTPLVAIADAEDDLFDTLKTVVRNTHAMPQNLLRGARSVIAYFLPFANSIPQSNRKGPHASEAWARAYIETNALIAAVNQHLASSLSDRGYSAALIPATHNFDEETLMSDWSHKHVAYIAGLGTFGLHHMLITAQGCAGRLGTLVTDAKIAPTPRPTHEACLHKYNGTCSTCVSRCVANALTDSGTDFDRHACYKICLENAERLAELGLTDICGKCACGMPCTSTDPVARILRRTETRTSKHTLKEDTATL